MPHGVAGINLLGIQRSLNAAGTRVLKASGRLSSGARIERASDDAAGLAISEQLNVKSRVYAQANRNLNDGISLTSIAKSAFDEMSRITMRQSELAAQSSNSLYSTAQRQALNEEARKLTEEYNRIVATTGFNGRSLFSESWKNTVIQIGEGDSGTLSLNFASDLSAKIDPGSYFRLNNVDSSNYIWFRVDGQGADPALQGATGIAVDLYTETNGAPTEMTLEFQPPGDIADMSAIDISSPSGGCFIQFDAGLSGVVLEDGWYRLGLQGLSSASEVASAAAGIIQGAGVFDVTSAGGGVLQITTLDPGGGSALDYGSGTVIDSIQGWVHEANADAKGVASAVSQALAVAGYQVTNNNDGTIDVKTFKGTVPDAYDVDSNVWITVLQQGVGITNYGAESSVQKVKTADLNNDGWEDLIASHQSGNSNVTILFNDGQGGFSAPVGYTMGNGQIALQTGDLNGDGAQDLLTAAGGRIYYRVNNGDGTFGALNSFTMNYTHDFRVADMNGDGRQDVITAGTTIQGFYIRYNNTDGSFSAVTAYTTGQSQKYFEVGDVDGDGLNDLVLGPDTNNYNLNVVLNAGGGTFSAPVSYTMGKYARAIGLADFNGDGKLDMVSGSGLSDFISVRLNNGDGTFGAHAAYSQNGNGNPRGFALADYNGDGRTDIAMATWYAGMQVWLNNSDGTFGRPTDYFNSQTLDSIASADLDHDGKIDLVSGNNFGDEIVVRRNQGDGLFTTPFGDLQEITRLQFGDARGELAVKDIDLTTVAGARRAIETLEARLGKIIAQSASVGAAESRIGCAAGQVQALRDNYLEASERITGADIAMEAAEMTKGRILQDLGSKVLAMAAHQLSSVLDLLR